MEGGYVLLMGMPTSPASMKGSLTNPIYVECAHEFVVCAQNEMYKTGHCSNVTTPKEQPKSDSH